jgi:hypothetical protein
MKFLLFEILNMSYVSIVIISSSTFWQYIVRSHNNKFIERKPEITLGIWSLDA